MRKPKLVRHFVVMAALSLLLPLCFAQLREVPEPAAGTAVVSQDDYIVTFRPGLGQAERAAAVVRAGAKARFNFSIIDAVAVRVPNVNVLAAIQRDMRVVSIVPDRPVRAFVKPTKPGGGSSGQVTPEGVKRVNIPVSGSDGSGIAVAVLDTGIDLNHADLAIGSSRFDAFGGSCQDGDGHGTHVTGIIAALDNSIDVVGVAPKATPYCVKVLDDNGSGTDSTVIAGLDWVYSNRTQLQIRVANMSLGRDKVDGDMALDSPMRAAIRQLHSSGIIVVAAAGNEATKEVIQKVPAGFPEVLAVASTTAKDGSNSCRFLGNPIRKDTASFFTTDGWNDYDSTSGPIGVTISAPGEDQENVSRGCLITSVGILSLKAGGGTIRYSGTSMAAPHVTGVVARILQTGSAIGFEGVRNYLRDNASVKGTAPLDSPISSYSFDGEREGVAVAP